MENLIFLIGFRAVGKTTVGKELAVRLGCDFLDTDLIICQRKAASIEQIVKAEGWEGFRHLESEVLAELAECSNSVVATGGGAIMHREPWLVLRRNALIVWLTAPPEALVSRFRQDEGSGENRPSLTGKDISAEILDILKIREPFYRETAHLVIDTEMIEVAKVVDKIQQAYVQKMGRGKK
ncbi:MAG: shikimate kinase AroL [Desulfoprunum sp.]|nr:shikimate kinase AroL [Desulfoprunum sp.]